MYVVPKVTTTNGRSSPGGHGESQGAALRVSLIAPRKTTWSGGDGHASSSRGRVTSTRPARSAGVRVADTSDTTGNSDRPAVERKPLTWRYCQRHPHSASGSSPGGLR